VSTSTQVEHETLLEFLYQCPVGLASISPEGDIHLLNAVGAQVLMPIAGGNIENFWKILDPFDPGLDELRTKPAVPGHAVCKARRLRIPADGRRPEQWLSLDLIRLGGTKIQACFFDITETVEIEARELAARQAQAQQEGKIEIITNVLHDIGNAVTGLGTRAACLMAEGEWPELQRCIQLRQFVTEQQQLLAGALGPSKSQALIGFISALADSITRRREGARNTATFFTRTVGHIQEILNVQRQLVTPGRGNKPVPLSLSEMFADAFAIQEGSLIKRGVRVQTNIPQNLPKIDGDRTRLLQVLINLIKNASEAFDSSPSDSERTMGVEAGLERAADGNARIRLVIRDSGPGFPSEQAEDFFLRGHTRKAGGSGFGLPHARSIVDAHSGTLTLQSDGPGTGAAAILTLPIHQL